MRERLYSARAAGPSTHGTIQTTCVCFFFFYYAPVFHEPEHVQENDIVFCQVGPGGRYYAHLVLAKNWHDARGEWVFWINNLTGRSNGWRFIDKVYGRLIDCMH